MSQILMQAVFVAIFVLFAFDDGPKLGPVKIRSLFFPIFKFKYEFVTFAEVADATLADIKYWTIHMHDYFRSMVARGLYPNKNGTMLPTASQMFALINAQLSDLTRINVYSLELG